MLLLFTIKGVNNIVTKEGWRTMAFFNDLGKKVSQMGQITIQKTKDYADIAKINSGISDEEKRIENLYKQIGKQYVETHKTDFEPEYAEMIGQLEEARVRIEELKNQIQSIKGVVRCPNCGAEVVNNSLFCSSCGTKIEYKQEENKEEATEPQAETVETAPAKKFCGKCGTEIEADAEFCPSCGEKVE